MGWDGMGWDEKHAWLLQVSSSVIREKKQTKNTKKNPFRSSTKFSLLTVREIGRLRIGQGW